jgi:hypothetical protein
MSCIASRLPATAPAKASTSTTISGSPASNAIV